MRLALAVEMTLRRLGRNRVAVVLLVLVPIAFQLVMLEVAPRRSVEVELASVAETEMAMPPVRLLPGPLPPGESRGATIEAPARSIALVHVSIAAVSMLAAFLGLTLMQRDADANRRLVLCGMRPWNLLGASLVALLLVVVAVTGIASVLLFRVVGAGRPAVLLLGLLLAGWVYGCYGLLVGSALRTGLAGMLCIVLLSNLDVMWLQNPMDYADARTRSLIRALPGHLPFQVGLVGAFEDHDWTRQALGACAYGAFFFLAAAAILGWRSRVRPHPAPEAGPARQERPPSGGRP